MKLFNTEIELGDVEERGLLINGALRTYKSTVVRDVMEKLLQQEFTVIYAGEMANPLKGLNKEINGTFIDMGYDSSVEAICLYATEQEGKCAVVLDRAALEQGENKNPQDALLKAIKDIKAVGAVPIVVQQLKHNSYNIEYVTFSDADTVNQLCLDIESLPPSERNKTQVLYVNGTKTGGVKQVDMMSVLAMQGIGPIDMGTGRYWS